MKLIFQCLSWMNPLYSGTNGASSNTSEDMIILSYFLEPMSALLFGKRELVDVIKVRLLRWDYSGLSQWVPNPVINVLIRDPQRRDTQINRRWSQRLELYSHKPRNSWSPHKLEETRKGPLQSRQEKHGLADTLSLSFGLKSCERISI